MSSIQQREDEIAELKRAYGTQAILLSQIAGECGVIRAQRDELLAALRQARPLVASLLEGGSIRRRGIDVEAAVVAIDTAIARVEGEKA